MKRAAIYYRVSTDDQSVDMQVAELRRYAKDRGFNVVAEHPGPGQRGKSRQTWFKGAYGGRKDAESGRGARVGV